MLRFVVRFAGLVLLAAGFAGLVADGARSLANSAWLPMSVGEGLMRWMPASLKAWEAGIRQVHPLLWEGAALMLRFPASGIGCALGLLLLWIGRAPPEPVGVFTRR